MTLPTGETNEKSWVGVDLDGTLAHYDGWRGLDHIGDPIPRMLDRVRSWLAIGLTVKLFTARAAEGQAALGHIRAWLIKHDLPLEITNVKDMHMISLYDDRAVVVEKNTGSILSPEIPLAQMLEWKSCPPPPGDPDNGR